MTRAPAYYTRRRTARQALDDVQRHFPHIWPRFEPLEVDLLDIVRLEVQTGNRTEFPPIGDDQDQHQTAVDA